MSYFDPPIENYRFYYSRFSGDSKEAGAMAGFSYKVDERFQEPVLSTFKRGLPNLDVRESHEFPLSG
jgi:hypothetical protein